MVWAKVIALNVTPNYFEEGLSEVAIAWASTTEFLLHSDHMFSTKQNSGTQTQGLGAIQNRQRQLSPKEKLAGHLMGLPRWRMVSPFVLFVCATLSLSCATPATKRQSLGRTGVARNTPERSTQIVTNNNKPQRRSASTRTAMRERRLIYLLKKSFSHQFQPGHGSSKRCHTTHKKLPKRQLQPVGPHTSSSADVRRLFKLTGDLHAKQNLLSKARACASLAEKKASCRLSLHATFPNPPLSVQLSLLPIVWRLPFHFSCISILVPDTGTTNPPPSQVVSNFSFGILHVSTKRFLRCLLFRANRSRPLSSPSTTSLPCRSLAERFFCTFFYCANSPMVNQRSCIVRKK